MKGGRGAPEACHRAGPNVAALVVLLTGAASLVLSCPAPCGAEGRKVSSEKRRKAGGGHHGSSGLSAPRLDLSAFDLATGVALVEVSGAARAPESRLFVFTDDRNRRFVPSLSECKPGPVAAIGVKVADAGATAPKETVDSQPAGETGKGERSKAGPGKESKEDRSAPGHFSCTLGIPRIYQRTNLVGLSVEIHGQVVNVAPDRVQAAWAVARAQTPLLPAERVRPAVPWTRPRSVPDGGPTADVHDVESEGEQE